MGYPKLGPDHKNDPFVPSEPHGFCVYDVGRYDGWTLDQIIAGMRGSTLNLLKRGTMKSLIARREWGGLLVAAAKLVTTAAEQMQLFRRVLDLNYPDCRKHMKLWVFWPRIAKMLDDREDSCVKRSVPFVVPGYERCLELAGISGRMGPPIPLDPPPPPYARAVCQAMSTALKERVEELELLESCGT